MNCGEALKFQREAAGLSQNALSKATGISQPMISFWESNKAIPGINFCIQLAQFYGITLDELVGLSDTPTTTTTRSLPTQPQSNVVAFANEYADIINDSNFVDISKLYKAITPELRAVVLGYAIGLLQSKGINTAEILKY